MSQSRQPYGKGWSLYYELVIEQFEVLYDRKVYTKLLLRRVNIQSVLKDTTRGISDGRTVMTLAGKGGVF